MGRATNPVAEVAKANSVPVSGSASGKNSLLKTSAAAELYRKKSYHSREVPIRLATTTLRTDWGWLDELSARIVGILSQRQRWSSRVRYRRGADGKPGGVGDGRGMGRGAARPGQLRRERHRRPQRPRHPGRAAGLRRRRPR